MAHVRHTIAPFDFLQNCFAFNRMRVIEVVTRFYRTGERIMTTFTIDNENNITAFAGPGQAEAVNRCLRAALYEFRGTGGFGCEPACRAAGSNLEQPAG